MVCFSCCQYRRMSCTIIISEIFREVHPEHFDVVPALLLTETALSNSMAVIVREGLPLMSKLSLPALFVYGWRWMKHISRWESEPNAVEKKKKRERASVIRGSTNVEPSDIMLPAGSGLILQYEITSGGLSPMSVFLLLKFTSKQITQIDVIGT